MNQPDLILFVGEALVGSDGVDQARVRVSVTVTVNVLLPVTKSILGKAYIIKLSI